MRFCDCSRSTAAETRERAVKNAVQIFTFCVWHNALLENEKKLVTLGVPDLNVATGVSFRIVYELATCLFFYQTQGFALLFAILLASIIRGTKPELDAIAPQVYCSPFQNALQH